MPCGVENCCGSAPFDHRLRIEPFGVVRHLAVGAPVTQVLAGRAVEHDHAAVAVAVGDVDLVVRRVDPDARRSAEQVRVGAAAGLLVLADRQQVLAFARELHHAMTVVAADPDEVVVIDEDAVRFARPVGHVVVGALSPALNQLALLIELENGRRGLAAGAHLHRLFLRRRRRGSRRTTTSGTLGRRRDDVPRLLVEFFLGERFWKVRHPDVLLRVDEDAGDRAHDPVIGHFQRPARIDLEGAALSPLLRSGRAAATARR